MTATGSNLLLWPTYSARLNCQVFSACTVNVVEPRDWTNTPWRAASSSNKEASVLLCSALSVFVVYQYTEKYAVYICLLLYGLPAGNTDVCRGRIIRVP